MEKLDIKDLHLHNWQEMKDGMLCGGSAETDIAIERIAEKINEIIDFINLTSKAK